MAVRRQGTAQNIKLVVWDLDNTLWQGVFMENPQIITLNDDAVKLIKKLDSHGILQSIVSKNDHEVIKRKLMELKLFEYFLYPQINWQPKSKNITTIAKLLNLNLNSMAFIDDSAYEIEEVKHHLPEVTCFLASDINKLANDKRLKMTAEKNTLNRRLIYQQEAQRKQAEEKSALPKEAFLKTLLMKMSINDATENDLDRIKELTLRTSQLNTTGLVFSQTELKKLIHDKHHKILIVELTDKFGDYGKIGLIIIEHGSESWYINLLIISCRVIFRGIGNAILSKLLCEAKTKQKKVFANFVQTDYNRAMYITYKLFGFKEVKTQGKKLLLEHDLENIPPIPSHIEIFEGKQLEHDYEQSVFS